MPVLLIQTVGGAPEPLIKAITHHQPARIVFLASPETESQVESSILPGARASGFVVGAGNYEVRLVPDAQDLDSCAAEVGRLRSEIQAWRDRGADHEVVVDFTGGTKCMTAATAIASLYWPCGYSYVGGERRDKAGVGIVVSGTERMVYQADPAQVRLVREREGFVAWFNEGEFGPAQELAVAERNRAPEPVKTEWQALAQLAEAYEKWDLFQYPEARSCLERMARFEPQLDVLLGPASRVRLMVTLQQHAGLLAALRSEPTDALLHDLLANARRRARRRRWDDAVARLYRAVEVGAQARLLEGYSIATGAVRIDALPAALRSEPDLCRPGRRDPACAQWGLQQAYGALELLGDPLGRQFNATFTSPKGALEERNQSLLAHGFSPVSKNGYTALWKAVGELFAIEEDGLVQFPELPRL
jgi:CRISPR-associated protein (TIGR02710 family)